MRFTPAPPPAPQTDAAVAAASEAQAAVPAAAETPAAAAASAATVQAAEAPAASPDTATPGAGSAAAAAAPPAATGDTEPPPRATAAVGGLGVFVPLLIALVALVAWSAFQFYQLRLESEAMAALRTNQESPLQQAQRVRQNLENLAARTRQLAEAGNANARLVVNELSRRGVKIGPPASAAATP